jgi:hypothetical protein
MRAAAVAAALTALLCLAGPASAELVTAELRAGDDQETAPLAPVYNSVQSDRTRLSLRALTLPTLEDAGTGESVADCTPTMPRPAYDRPFLRSSRSVAGEDFSIFIEPCRPPFQSANFVRLEILGSGDKGAFRMRYETSRSRGSRDGVIEPPRGGKFTLVYWYWSTFEDVGVAACLYDFASPTRIDVYNKGHGHKVDFEHERLTLTGTVGTPARPCVDELELSLEGRLRAWGPKPGWPSDWTLPVWLGPVTPLP